MNTQVTGQVTGEAVARRRLALAAAALANVMGTIDYNIVSIAIPGMIRSFHGSTLAELSWVVNGYTVVFAAALLPAGGLADRIGTKRLFLWAVAVFTVGSVGCALAPGALWLVLARMAQAAGGGGMIASSISVALKALPDRPSQAIGLLAATGGIAIASGPSVGAALIAAGGWRLIFLVNVPIAVAVLALGAAGVHEQRAVTGQGLPDMLGVGLIGVAVGSLALFLVQGSGWGWASAASLAALAAGLVCGALAVSRSLRHPRPAVDLTLLRSRATAVGNTGLLVLGVAQFAVVLATTLFLTGAWHYSPAAAGFALTPGPCCAAATSWLSGHLIRRTGPGPVAAAGGVLGVAGWGWLAAHATGPPAYASVLLPALVLGFTGAAAASTAMNTAAVSTVPPGRTATGGALGLLSRSIGAAIGVAALAGLLHTQSLAHYRVAWLGMTGCLAAMVVAAAAIPRAGRRTPA